jgi:segregation and condensation protein B
VDLFSHSTDPSADPTPPPPLVRIVEALLFVGSVPLTPARAAELIRGVSADQLAQAVAALNRDYRQQGRPYRIQGREQGYELTLRPRFRAILERFQGSTREARLSAAALDTLALVAYRQPLTLQEIDSLRGADSQALLRQLVRLGLIAVQKGTAAGTALPSRPDGSGEPPHEGTDAGNTGGLTPPRSPDSVVYGTTPRFLKLFGLRSLDDLPRTQDAGRM